MSEFYIRDNNILQNALGAIRTIMDKGGTARVKVTDEKETRRDRQNRVMQMWFADIANVSGNGVVYEAGRCKLQYFLPVMRASDKARETASLIDALLQVRGYEVVSRALGTSAIASTRELTVRQFAEALEMMREGERQYPLRDPATYGIDDWGRR